MPSSSLVVGGNRRRQALQYPKKRSFLVAPSPTPAREDKMPTFIMMLNWTEQGIRAVKDASKRSQAARELAKKMGVEIKHVYMTTGDHDLLAILETANGDNVAKFALAISALGNVRTRTVRAWSESEYMKLVSELP
jgi:uncharacterized protein with GYD domain